jgi:hypothetical protein
VALGMRDTDDRVFAGFRIDDQETGLVWIMKQMEPVT